MIAHILYYFSEQNDLVLDPMAKWWLAEMANRVAYDCVQLHGGYGYMEEYPICRWYWDIRASSIYAGTTEIMKTIIAKGLGF